MTTFIKKNKLLFITIMIYIGLLIFKVELFTVSIKNSLYYFKEMIEILPVVFILISVIEAWIPKSVIIKRLGENSGLKGLGLSFMLGSLSAGPLYAAFPLSKILLSKGASVENIVIIISAWAVVKVPMLINEVKFLGFRFMSIRWIFSVIAILVMAKLIGMVVKKDDMPIKEVDVKPSLNPDYCINCGLCIKALPEYFSILDGKVYLDIEGYSDENLMKLQMIAKKCPGNAISIGQKKANK